MRSWPVLFVLLALPAAGLEPFLVKDINLVPSPGGSGPAAFTALGNVAVFEASEGSDRVLWRSDGTAEGTRPLVDTCPGCTDAVEPFARIGDRLFFLGYEPEAIRKSLWVTDGTAASRLTGPLSAGGWVAAQGFLYFVADGGIWRSDGSSEGTRLVVASSASQLTAFQGRIWFVRGKSLWRSDGTPAGTVLVRKLSREPRILGAVGKHLLLAAGDELWSTDGILARDLGILDAVVQGGRLWFVAETRRGQELWISDGKAAQRLTRFSRKQAFFAPSEAMYLGLPRSSPDGRFIFAVHDGIHGPEPWVSDGTYAGTRLLRDLCPGPCAGIDALGLAQGGNLYFTGNDGILGRELWSTDGNRVDLVRDVCPGSCDGNPGSLIVLGDRVLFAADDGVNGMELWTAEGRLSDFEPRVPWVSLHGAALPGAFLFGADDGEHGLELWATDGSETRLVRDLDEADRGGSFPSGLRALGDTVLFFADDGIHGYELWKSDGTNTVLVAELVPGEEPREPPEVVASAVVGGELFLSLEGALWKTDGVTVQKMADIGARELAAFQGSLHVGPESASHLTVHAGRLWFFDSAGLWSTDGTTAVLEAEGLTGSLLASLGERLIVLNHHPGSPWTVFQGRLYYSALSGGLWTTDGTPEGTEPLGLDIPPVSAFATFGDRLLFITSLPGAPLWETDGTAAGTLKVGDLAPGWIGQWELLAAGPRVFFLAFEHDTGVELWAVD
jgi:ELWxxDGT repeat protein